MSSNVEVYVLEKDACVRTADLADAARAIDNEHPVWMHIHERSEEIDRVLRENFRLHPLAIEDIWNESALPKIEDFDEYLYLRVHGVQLANDAKSLELLEVDIVLGQTFVITHQHGSSAAVTAVADELKRSPKLLKKGPVWVVHALVDHLIDDYLPVLDEIDVHVEELEDSVFASASERENPGMMRDIFSMKRSLYALRRTSVHQRDILMRLSRAEFDEIPREAMPFFRDVYDHFTRVTDMTDNYRDLVTNAFEGYLSVQSHRMNQIMKTLTLISTVMLPLTFIAGVYGMNFHFMPELSWTHGYAFALALMAVVAIGIVTWFKMKKWA